MSKRPRPSPPLYLLRLPNLLSHADIARLERITKDTTYSTAYEAPALRPPRRAKAAATSSETTGSSGTAALLAGSEDESDDESDDADFDPDDPDPCSCFAHHGDCPQFLFKRLKAAVREGARKWPSALPAFSSGRVRYENVHAMSYGVGDKKSWHLDAFPASKRPKGPPGFEDARALSVVVCLEPCDAGGVFEVVRGSAPEMLASGEPSGLPEAVPLRAGDAVVFPSKRLMHQVSAVTLGRRKSIALFARTPSKPVAAQESDSADSDFDYEDED